jgi:hypothetical protein
MPPSTIKLHNINTTKHLTIKGHSLATSTIGRRVARKEQRNTLDLLWVREAAKRVLIAPRFLCLFVPFQERLGHSTCETISNEKIRDEEIAYSV